MSSPISQARPEPTRDDDQPITLRGVSFRFPGAHEPAVEDVTLEVIAGERLGVLGPNGGGKTTLIRLCLGLIEPTAGSVRVFGLPPRVAARNALVGVVAQGVSAELAFPLSVRQVAAMAAQRSLEPWRSPSAEDRERVEHAIELVGMSDLADRPIGKLSGGQVQRTLIARAIAPRPRLLLLDEPTVGIDVSGQQRFVELLDRVQRELSLTVVMVTHDLRSLAAGCDRLAVLSRTLHLHAAPGGVTPEVLTEVFRHDVAAAAFRTGEGAGS